MRQFPQRFEVRDFDVEGDGRTVMGRIVPYGETIEFYDPWDGQMKKERFVPGAFGRQARPGAWSQVGLSYQHDDGFHNTLGYGRELKDRPDGAYATFRLYEPDANKAREMIENTHKGLSLEFEPRGREKVDADGVIVRDNVRVRRVGITPDPAYSGAKVLAVRDRSDGHQDDEDDEGGLVVATPNLDAVRADLARLRGQW